MIRIHRPANAPAVLRNRGQTETTSHCALYDANPAGYDSGSVKFQHNVYGSTSIRNALKACQHNKCCYSEAKFVRDSVHVEHFRPKGAVGEKGSNTKLYPGYYWLANDWANLLVCKAGVNSDKRDYFPLQNERARAKNHHDDIGLESPILIDPASEEPRDHIRFRNEEPYGITERGRYTVDLLLRHPDLDDNRRERFQHLMALKDALEIYVATADPRAADTKALLNDARNADSAYSSMAIDLLS